MTPAAEEALRTLERELTEHDDHTVCEDCREEMERLLESAVEAHRKADKSWVDAETLRAELRDTRELLTQARKAREGASKDQENMRQALDKAISEAEDLSAAAAMANESTANLLEERDALLRDLERRQQEIDRLRDIAKQRLDEIDHLRASRDRVADAGARMARDDLPERVARLEALMGEAS